MSHHDTTVPLSVIDPTDDGDGEIEVSFDWTPGSAPSGEFGPPENYDPGCGDEFYIVDVTGSPLGHGPAAADKIIAYLEENWDRPDYAAEKADYLYEQYRDRQMERDDD